MKITLTMVLILSACYNAKHQLLHSTNGTVTSALSHANIWNITNLRGFTLNYTLEFPSEACCPLLLSYSAWTNHGRHRTRCCVSNAVARYDNTLVATNASIGRFNLRTKCEDYSHGMTRCSGSHDILFSSSKTWNFSLLYTEKRRKLLNVTYDLKLFNLTESAPQIFTADTHDCANYLLYNRTVLPNFFGQTDVNKISLNHISEINLDEFISDCYQHGMRLLCQGLFPREKNGRIYYPCKQMCMDAVVGCRAHLHESLQQVERMCSLLEDSSDESVCAYIPVDCGPVKQSDGVHVQYTYGNHSVGDAAKADCKQLGICLPFWICCAQLLL